MILRVEHQLCSWISLDAFTDAVISLIWDVVFSKLFCQNSAQIVFKNYHIINNKFSPKNSKLNSGTRCPDPTFSGTPNPDTRINWARTRAVKKETRLTGYPLMNTLAVSDQNHSKSHIDNQKWVNSHEFSNKAQNGKHFLSQLHLTWSVLRKYVGRREVLETRVGLKQVLIRYCY